MIKPCFYNFHSVKTSQVSVSAAPQLQGQTEQPWDQRMGDTGENFEIQ